MDQQCLKMVLGTWKTVGLLLAILILALGWGIHSSRSGWYWYRTSFCLKLSKPPTIVGSPSNSSILALLKGLGNGATLDQKSGYGFRRWAILPGNRQVGPSPKMHYVLSIESCTLLKACMYMEDFIGIVSRE